MTGSNEHGFPNSSDDSRESRLRRFYLGLSDDESLISEIPAEEKTAFKSRLLEDLHRPLEWFETSQSSDVSPHVNPLLIERSGVSFSSGRRVARRSRRWIGVLSASAAIVVGFVVLGVSNEVSAELRQNARLFWANITPFVRDTYSEQRSVITSPYGVNDLILPEYRYWVFGDRSKRQMRASLAALKASSFVQDGEFALAVAELNSIDLLTTPVENVFSDPALDLAFHLSVGKSLASISENPKFRTDDASAQTEIDIQVLPKLAEAYLIRAIDLLESDRMLLSDETDQVSLRAAIRIDVARLQLKYSSVAADAGPLELLQVAKKLERIQQTFDVAEHELQSIANPDDFFVQLQWLRLAGNEAMLMTRRAKLHPDEKVSMFLAEIQRLTNVIVDADSRLSLNSAVGSRMDAKLRRAVRLELAIDRSNLADMLMELSSFPQCDQPLERLKESIAVRQQVITELDLGTEQSRTQRHELNRLINHGRILVAQAILARHANQLASQMPFLREQAVFIDEHCQEILGEERGLVQLLSVTKVLAVTLLPEKYEMSVIEDELARLRFSDTYLGREVLQIVPELRRLETTAKG